MKQVIAGKLYNTNTMQILVSNTIYNNGNCIGTKELCVTKSGNYAIVYDSVDSIAMSSSILAIAKDDIAEHIEHWHLTDEESETLLARSIVAEA